MASYRVAQVGLGWAVFRLDSGLELVAGPFKTREIALNKLRHVPIDPVSATGAPPPRRAGRGGSGRARRALAHR